MFTSQCRKIRKYWSASTPFTSAGEIHIFLVLQMWYRHSASVEWCVNIFDQYVDVLYREKNNNQGRYNFRAKAVQQQSDRWLGHCYLGQEKTVEDSIYSGTSSCMIKCLSH